MEEPRTNIVVQMTIPPQRYMAATEDIMSQYGNVVEEAVHEIRKDLMFNKKFQDEVKNEIKAQIRESIENAIKSAAKRVVFDLYSNKSHEVENMVEKIILDTIKTQ